jgi:sensor domain CHASE-containing protein
MTIKNKLLIFSSIIILVTILGVITFIYFTARENLNNNIEIRAKLYKENFHSLLEVEKNKLTIILKDYANWEELGEMAVIKKDSDWIKENLYPWIKQHFGFDLVLLVKNNGEVIVNSFFDSLDYKYFILKEEKEKSGFYVSNRGLILFSTSGVFDNEGKKFYNAYLTFGYLINEKVLNEYKNFLDMDF